MSEKIIYKKKCVLCGEYFICRYSSRVYCEKCQKKKRT